MQHLEEMIAHLTRVVDDLSDVAAHQQGQIDRLERRVQMLMQREADRETEAGGTIPPASRKPPHW